MLYTQVPFEMITREEWQAVPSTSDLLKLKPRPSSIQLVDNTDSDECYTKDECLKTVKKIQTYHMTKEKYPDINFNFLIGGDGNVYEGRGWSKKIQKRLEWPKGVSNSIVIGLIGRFKAKMPPQKMLDVLDSFSLKYSTEGKLSKEPVEIKV